MKVAEPVTKVSFIALAANTIVAAIVTRLAIYDFKVSAEWVVYLTVAAAVVTNFLLTALLWGLGKLSTKVPWNTVRDKVTPVA